MKSLLTSLSFTLLAGLACGAEPARPASPPPPVARGDVFESASGTKLRILMDQAAFGGTELEIAEITFAPNSDSGEHVHGATETFYVLEGELEHFVNGKSVKLTAGMIGTVRPPDKVRHKTGPKGARALVIWAPAGEAARIASRWKRVEP
jgi:quercetin dioxygenase-like cupin family protein